MYRDADYDYSRRTGTIRFPQVYYVDYKSNHVDKVYAPEATRTPCFSHCERKVGNMVIEFDEETDSQRFMRALTLNHDLIFSRRVSWISNKRPSRGFGFGNQKGNRGNAEVQLWRKGQNIQLVSRWDDRVADKWMTMTVPRQVADLRGNGTKAVLPDMPYVRGSLIDLANLVATNPREPNSARKTRPITIAFEEWKGECLVKVTLLISPRRVPVRYMKKQAWY